MAAVATLAAASQVQAGGKLVLRDQEQLSLLVMHLSPSPAVGRDRTQHQVAGDRSAESRRDNLI
jgi:hypothetical protein